MCIALVQPAAAQFRPGDSLAVVRTVERFHAALRADDTVAVRGMLGPGAVILDQGKIVRMSEEQSKYLAFLGRWGRAITRKPGPINVHVLGVTAWAYSITGISAVAAPDAIRGQVSELMVLTRLGDSWFINAIMWSTASPDS
jgi:hypothetical protein